MLPRRGEACQWDDLDRVLLLTTVSIQGVVELGPGESLVQFIFFGHRPAQSMAAIHNPHVGFNSPGTALLEAKGGKGSGEGGGGGRGGGGAVASRALELGQGWGHPAAVGVAQYQTLLGAGLRGLSQGFLQVHLDGCENKSKRKNNTVIVLACQNTQNWNTAAEVDS